MATTPKYDHSKIDYDAVYYSVQADEAIRPLFDGAKVRLDKDGEPVIAERLVLVNIGTMRGPSDKVDRPVFQSEQVHAYGVPDLAKFRKVTKAIDVATVRTKRAAVTSAKVAGF